MVATLAMILIEILKVENIVILYLNPNNNNNNNNNNNSCIRMSNKSALGLKNLFKMFGGHCSLLGIFS